MATTENVVEVVMPQMGVSVSEGTVTKWLRQVGDEVRADDTLLEISTDKVDTEVPSPGTGVLQEILVPEGETVAVGTLLARIGPAGVAASAQPPSPAPLPAYVEPATAAETAPEPPPAPEPKMPEAQMPEVEPAPVAAEPAPAPAPAAEPPPPPPAHGNGASTERHTFVSPVVARIAAEHGIDPSAIVGTGRDGRVTKKDILAVVEADASTTASEPPAAAQAAPAPPAAPSPPAAVPEAPRQPEPSPAPTSQRPQAAGSQAGKKSPR